MPHSPEKPPQPPAPASGRHPAPSPGGSPHRAATPEASPNPQPNHTPGHTTPEATPNRAATPKPPSSPPPGIGLIGVGAILASMVLSGFLLGYWTDAWLDTRPLFMLLFAGLGLIGGILKVHKLLT